MTFQPSDEFIAQQSEKYRDLSNLIDFNDAWRFILKFEDALNRAPGRVLNMGLFIGGEIGHNYSLALPDVPLDPEQTMESGNQKLCHMQTLIVGPDYNLVLPYESPIKQVLFDTEHQKYHTKEGLYLGLSLHALSEVARANGFIPSKDVFVRMNTPMDPDALETLESDLDLGVLERRFEDYAGDIRFQGKIEPVDYHTREAAKEAMALFK